MFSADDDGMITVWPKPRGDDEDTLKIPTVDPKKWCMKCREEKKLVSYGFSNRTDFYCCPKCGEE